jgi:hypothetical protein
VECREGVGAFYWAGGMGGEAVGAGAQPMAIIGVVSSGGGNGEAKRGVGEVVSLRLFKGGAERRRGRRHKSVVRLGQRKETSRGVGQMSCKG